MRLFAGIELDEATRCACVDAQLRLQLAAFEARYEAPEKLHVTLAFLGTVADGAFDAVRDVLECTADRHAPFDLTLDKVGAFPNERRPRIIFAGARDQSIGFRCLTSALREAYAPLGFSFETDPVVHVTIARVKGGSRRPLPMIDFPASRLHVERIALFQSRHEGDTTRYEIREAASLRAASK